MLEAYYSEIEKGHYEITICNDEKDIDMAFGYTYTRHFTGYTKKTCLKIIREEIQKWYHVKRVHLIPLDCSNLNPKYVFNIFTGEKILIDD